MALPLTHLQEGKPRRGKMLEDPPFVIGRAAWWIPKAIENPYKKITFVEAMKDFLQNVSFHCYSKLVEPGRRFHERLFWIIFHFTMFGMLIAFLCDTAKIDQGFLSTNLYDPLYPINKVPFPTFSICSLNHISNIAATRYAEELNEKDSFKRGVSFFYNHIKDMNWPMNSEMDNNFDDSLEFQNFLDIFDTSDEEVFYNTRERMRKLTPTCEDLLIRCRMANEDFDCHTNFKLTLTATGFCCTFNHDGEYAKERPASLSFFKYKGITLLLNASESDEFYKQPISGNFAIYFHAYGDFADVLSGAVNERLVAAGMQTSLSIDAEVIQTVHAARVLPPYVRNCYFADEQPHIYGKKYSFNNCITRCRMHSILVLCNCLVFVYPEELLDWDRDFVYCTLRHRSCLQRYASKWANVITEMDNVPEEEQEVEYALLCPQCLPPCTWTIYDVNTNALPLTEYNKITFDEISQANVTNLALAQIFFKSAHAQWYRRFLKESWVEIISFVGSMVGITTGFSVTGFCELIYFVVYHLYKSVKRELASDRKRKTKNPKQALLILP